MTERSRVAEGLGRGLRLRCPHCGEGRLFTRFLKVSPRCEVCGADNTIYPSDDAPPYLTLLLVGHFILPFMFWLDKAWAPAMWVQFAIWLPLITVVTIATLPFMKGAVVGIAWATGVTRQSARQ
ncbi:DUF983 domain-containing protein [Roseomonas eburnea]|uniref:DUF983 domain-containing protein n=1 Tax=Neoroseomonas eburnea TaxID=1346889 RepID=A0A9X9X7I0_9PROT|nr:DUF983 domain-containing protein [Neoroseomonas eburnea]MBR0679666.1 DUF983 domain-containing protein [Neoroseomonas eburnea]